jgi:uncharacterized protein (DUF1697 family)
VPARTGSKVVDRRVALLRGINVGKTKRIAMADLRALVEGLGYTDVATLLNSGNVVFTVPASAKGDPASRIEKTIATKLGVATRVSVVDGVELAAIVDGHPFAKVARDPSRYLVGILSDGAEAKLAPLQKKDWAPDALAVRGRVVYLWCASGILESALGKEVGRVLKDAYTTRNWATILKLHALTGPNG